MTSLPLPHVQHMHAMDDIDSPGGELDEEHDLNTVKVNSVDLEPVDLESVDLVTRLRTYPCGFHHQTLRLEKSITHSTP